jgi:protein Mpv17
LLHVFAAAWRLYSNALDHQPLAAKALTAGCVGGLGDLLSQRVAGHDIVDVERLLAVVVDGLCVSGPGLHVGYALLERRIPCAGRGPLRNVALQLLIDECIFDPAFIGAFFFSTGFVERQHPWRDTLPHLRAAYWPTLRGAMLTSAAFTPIQFVSFRYLPVKCRVLVVNLCDVLWYAAVSLGRHSGREASA